MDGLAISKRKITVSTCGNAFLSITRTLNSFSHIHSVGVVPLIERLGKDFPGIRVAISLHAVNDKLRYILFYFCPLSHFLCRSEIVPINRQWPIAELIEACKNFPGAKYTKKITFEYVMLKVFPVVLGRE